MTEPQHNKASKARRGAGRADRHALLRCILLYAGMTLVLAAMFIVSMIPKTYDLRTGQVSGVTIVATKDVEDKITTDQLRSEAAAAVTPTYIFESGITESVMAHFDQLFSQLALVRQYGESLGKQKGEGYTREELEYAASMLTGMTLRDDQMATLLGTSAADFDALYESLFSATLNTMNGHVTEGQEGDAIENISRLVGYKTDMDLLQNVVLPVLRACIQPNMIIDQEALENARQQARKSVETVMIKQGQNIVIKGERVTSNQIAILSTLGLLDDDDVDLTAYVAVSGLVVITMALLLLVLANITKGFVRDFRRVLIFSMTAVVTMGLSLLTRSIHLYLMPVILTALLITTLDSIRAGLSANTAFSVLAALLAISTTKNNLSGTNALSGMYRIFLMTLLSGTTACLIMRKSRSRLKTLIAGLAAAAVSTAVMLILSLVTEVSQTGAWQDTLWAISGPVLSGLIAMAMQPLLETLFNLPTPVRLLELSNPNSPLLRRLMAEAPGTYHHSILVANLAEAAAEAVGANPVLARVGAYYHDIGKLKRPQYFSENQRNGENVHDHTEPEMSARILTAHPRDGVALAREYRLPAEIQEIIADHHGNSPVIFFYHKAVQQAGGKPVDINAFRYDGNRPGTKEAAIIMICDTVEAAVRSRKDQMTQEELEAYIVKLVRGKLADGQLNDAPLTLHDIDAICESCTMVLKGVNHERVAYPGDKSSGQRRAGQKKQQPAPVQAAQPPQPAAQPAAQPAQPAGPAQQPAAPAAQPAGASRQTQPLPVVPPPQPAKPARQTQPLPVVPAPQPAPPAGQPAAAVIVNPPPAQDSVLVDDLLQETAKPEEIEIETENAPAYILPDANLYTEEPAAAEEEPPQEENID